MAMNAAFNVICIWNVFLAKLLFVHKKPNSCCYPENRCHKYSSYLIKWKWATMHDLNVVSPVYSTCTKLKYSLSNRIMQKSKLFPCLIHNTFTKIILNWLQWNCSSEIFHNKHLLRLWKSFEFEFVKESPIFFQWKQRNNLIF